MNQIREDALAQLFVDQDIRHTGCVVALDADLYIGQLRLNGLQRAIENSGDLHGPQVEVRRPREIQKPRHQSVDPVHFGRNVAGEFARERLGVL